MDTNGHTILSEDYVSFEVAKLLKEKGFDIECNTAYYNGSLIDYTMYGFCIDGEFIFAPTHQMTMKWLRVKHNIHIECIFIRLPFGYRYNIAFLNKTIFHDRTNNISYITPEDAIEAALTYCLENLI